MTPTPAPDAGHAAETMSKPVMLSMIDAQRIAMIVNDARLRLTDQDIDRLRRPAIELAHDAITDAIAAAVQNTAPARTAGTETADGSR